MKILVVDHARSFSLVPNLVKATKGKHEIITMASVKGTNNVAILKQVGPDIILCEWGDENAALLSSMKSHDMFRAKLVVRLHGYESHDWFVNRIEWRCVDQLVTVSPYFERLMTDKLYRLYGGNQFGKGPSVSCIENGVDLDKFQNNSNHYELNSIAWVGYLNMKKGPALLRCVAESYPTMEINVAGKFQCENTRRLLYENRPDNLIFHDWIEDTPSFYSKNSWILSTSVTESFSYAVAEGMACGLTPMVFAWPGAEKLWPKECIWKSMADLGRIKLKRPEECRKWIEDRYSKEQQIQKFIDLFESI